MQIIDGEKKNDRHQFPDGKNKMVKNATGKEMSCLFPKYVKEKLSQHILKDLFEELNIPY